MQQPVPTYQLYGELLAGSSPEPVHYETIRERSSRHDWTIRLHRHRRQAQVFLFETTGVFIRAGDIDHQSKAPLILLVPPGVVHGFRFPEDIRGGVLTLPLDRLDPDIADAVERISAGGAFVLERTKQNNFDNVSALMGQVHAMFPAMTPLRGDLLIGLTRLILTYLMADAGQRQAGDLGKASAEQSRDEQRAQAFCDAVEAHFSTEMTVADYATHLGISAPHLTRICKRMLGSPPKDLIRQRRIVEAKRLLEYTRNSIADIGFRSGFRDAAFFSRTFRSVVGATPRAYRAERDG